MQKKENTWKIKKQNFKTEKKKRKQNKWGKKGTSKMGKKWKNGFVHLHCFCIYVAFSICFFAFIVLLLFFALSSRFFQVLKKLEKAVVFLK